LWEPKNAHKLGLVTKGKSRQLQEHLKFGSSTLSSLKSGPSQIVLHSPRPDRQDSGTSCTHHNGKLEARLLAGWCRHRVPGTRNHGWPHLFRACLGCIANQWPPNHHVGVSRRQCLRRGNANWRCFIIRAQTCFVGTCRPVDELT
jgi:hypothetical protein